MENVARVRLRELVDQYGAELADDSRRTRAILNDALPNHRREASALIAAVDEGVAGDLRSRVGHAPDVTLVSQLSLRLARDHAMDPDAARWAVESWAHALGLNIGSPVVLDDGGGVTQQSTIGGDERDGAKRPPEGPPGQWPLLRAAAGVVVLLLIIAAAVWAVTNGNGGEETPTPGPTPSATPTPTPTTTPTNSHTASPTPTTEVDSVEVFVPSHIVGSCAPRTGTPITNSLDEVICDVSGADSVTYVLFGSRNHLYAEYDAVIDHNVAGGRDTGDCPESTPGESGWHYGEETANAGRVACYVDDEDGVPGSSGRGMSSWSTPG